MKISFFLNQMGVAANRWYEENNIPYQEYISFNNILNKEITVKAWDTHYACGRIDIHGVPNEPYGLEYSVGIMEQESWNKLGGYLSKLKLEYVPTEEQIFKMFEKDTAHKIKWWGW